MIGEAELRADIQEHGFAIRSGVLSFRQVGELLETFRLIGQSPSTRRRGGVRNLLDEFPEVRELADSGVLRELVEALLGAGCFPVRGILFDKTPQANWKVPWHQDVTIAVQHRVEAEGFGPWTMKEDVLHVQPPAYILERMISVRIHLDSCNEENGALRVIPGSHARGRIPEGKMAAVRLATPERICQVESGDVLLMRPLLVHASSPSQVPDHRRVIHIDFAADELPVGMRWFSARL